jgi:hypothetical protein
VAKGLPERGEGAAGNGRPDNAPAGAAEGAYAAGGAGAGAGAEEEAGLSIRERVERVRQSVASELAFVAPSLGFVSLFTVTAIQLGLVLTAGAYHLLTTVHFKPHLSCFNVFTTTEANS